MIDILLIYNLIDVLYNFLNDFVCVKEINNKQKKKKREKRKERKKEKSSKYILGWIIQIL